MRGPGRIAVPLLCVLFTALGIFLIVVGDRLIGGACVLSFGEALRTLELCLADRGAQARLGST